MILKHFPNTQHMFFRSRLQKVNYRQKEKQVLDSILGKGYDQRIRPSGRNDTGKILIMMRCAKSSKYAIGFPAKSVALPVFEWYGFPYSKFYLIAHQKIGYLTKKLDTSPIYSKVL